MADDSPLQSPRSISTGDESFPRIEELLDTPRSITPSNTSQDFEISPTNSPEDAPSSPVGRAPSPRGSLRDRARLIVRNGASRPASLHSIDEQEPPPIQNRRSSASSHSSSSGGMRRRRPSSHDDDSVASESAPKATKPDEVIGLEAIADGCGLMPPRRMTMARRASEDAEEAIWSPPWPSVKGGQARGQVEEEEEEGNAPPEAVDVSEKGDKEDAWAEAEPATPVREPSSARRPSPIRTAADLRQLPQRARLQQYRQLMWEHVQHMIRAHGRRRSARPPGSSPQQPPPERAERSAEDRLREALGVGLDVPYVAAVMSPMVKPGAGDRQAAATSPTRTCTAAARQPSPSRKEQQRNVEVLSVPNPRGIYLGAEAQWPPPPANPYKRSTNTTGRQRPPPGMTASEAMGKRGGRERRGGGGGAINLTEFLDKNDAEVQARRRAKEGAERRVKQEARACANPTICPGSAALIAGRAKERARHGSIHDRLYHMAPKHRPAIEQLGEEFTFRPCISSTSIRMAVMMRPRTPAASPPPPPPPPPQPSKRKARRKTKGRGKSKKVQLKPPENGTKAMFPFKPQLTVTTRKTDKLLRRSRTTSKSFEDRLLASVLQYYSRTEGP